MWITELQRCVKAHKRKYLTPPRQSDPLTVSILKRLKKYILRKNFMIRDLRTVWMAFFIFLDCAWFQDAVR